MESWEIWVLCAVFIAYAMVSRIAQRWLVTAPMIFLALGFAFSVDGFDIVQIDVEDSGVEVLTELTLAVILFVDASRLSVHRLKRQHQLPIRLLAIGLPLSIAAGALLTWGIFPAVGVTVAALVGSVLAPTDAALGQPVVSDPAVPAKIRQALNVESGLNDGLALPVVTVFLAILAQDDHDIGYWIGFMVEQIGYGTAVGVATGGASAWLIVLARREEWIDGIFGQLAVALVPILAFAGSAAVGGNGLIAAFVGGISFGAVAKTETSHMTEYAEDSGQLLAAAAFFLFGNIVLVDAFVEISWQIIVASAAILTVGRMFPVWLALLGSGASPQTAAFMGWFGPRGLASIVFGLMVAETELLPEGSPALGIIGCTVLGSVVLHGISAGPGARAYGRWWDGHETEKQDGMIESHPVTMPPVRWSARSKAWGVDPRNDGETEGHEI